MRGRISGAGELTIASFASRPMPTLWDDPRPSISDRPYEPRDDAPELRVSADPGPLRLAAAVFLAAVVVAGLALGALVEWLCRPASRGAGQ